jgi:hypothetical protein
MAHAILRSFALRLAAAALASGFLGGLIGYASAQDAASGWLNPECAASCVTNGYDAEFCGQVCWVPDPAKTAEADNLDWKCMTSCSKRGGRTRDCMPGCRKH